VLALAALRTSQHGWAGNERSKWVTGWLQGAAAISAQFRWAPDRFAPLNRLQQQPVQSEEEVESFGRITTEWPQLLVNKREFPPPAGFPFLPRRPRS